MAKLDKRGFDENGLYHFTMGIKDTTKPTDKYGFDYEGMFVCRGVKYHFNHRGFEYRGYNVYTGKKYDFNHFDIDGYYWKEYNGEYQNSYSKYNEEGLDLYGFDRRGIHSKTNLPWDEYLFRADGLNIATNSTYNAYGFYRDECYKTPRSVSNEIYKHSEEYIERMKEFESIDRVYYTIDSHIAKGIIAEPSLRERFMDNCRELEKRKIRAKVYVNKKSV